MQHGNAPVIAYPIDSPINKAKNKSVEEMDKNSDMDMFSADLMAFGNHQNMSTDNSIDMSGNFLTQVFCVLYIYLFCS